MLNTGTSYLMLGLAVERSYALTISRRIAHLITPSHVAPHRTIACCTSPVAPHCISYHTITPRRTDHITCHTITCHIITSLARHIIAHRPSRHIVAPCCNTLSHHFVVPTLITLHTLPVTLSLVACHTIACHTALLHHVAPSHCHPSATLSSMCHVTCMAAVITDSGRT